MREAKSAVALQQHQTPLLGGGAGPEEEEESNSASVVGATGKLG
jgi:hypothetical protein